MESGLHGILQPGEVMEAVLTATSLLGAWLNTHPARIRAGYVVWMFANAGWFAHFVSGGDPWAAGLFAAYFCLSVRGFFRWRR